MASLKTKCDFCQYATRGSGSQKGCMVTPNSFYCKEANDEFYAWLQSQNKPKTKPNYGRRK